MKTLCYKQATALLLAASLCSISALAEETAAKTEAMDPKMAEMMKKAEEAGTPGKEHKLLNDLFAGSWSADVKCWMPGKTEPIANTGSSKAEMILNGRFLREEFTGEFMGKPFRGIGITGYDKTSKKFTNVWMDDMSTAILVTEGSSDDDGKTLTFTGKMTCPAEGTEKPVKLVIKITDTNKHTFEMHDPSLGEKSKTMEITYIKK